MMGKLHKAWALSGAEWRLLLKVALLLPLVRLSVKLLPFKSVVSLFPGKQSRDGNATGAPAIRPERVAYLVEAVARHHFLKPTCLEKALVLSGLLNRCGVEADLRIGTAKQDGKFEAHAWVEHRGQALQGGPVERYAPLLPRKPVATGLPACPEQSRRSRHSEDGQECPSPLQDQPA